jgi:16S rRNA (uracil1498-N3)-methyltransferase
MIRVLCPVPDPPSNKLRLAGDRFHYLTRVLRLGTGDSLQVFDGKSRTFAARILFVGTSELELELTAEQLAPQTRPIILLQGLPKGEKLDWILQKGTELGMTTFAAVAMQHCVAKLRPSQIEERRRRWQKIAEEAARQSGRSDVPVILPYRPLSDAVAALSLGTRLFVLNKQERSKRLGQALGSLEDPQQPIALLAGPEGGIDPSEMEWVLRAGGVSVGLGSRILRTETASLAALAVILHLEGDLG